MYRRPETGLSSVVVSGKDRRCPLRSRLGRGRWPDHFGRGPHVFALTTYHRSSLRYFVDGVGPQCPSRSPHVLGPSGAIINRSCHRLQRREQQRFHFIRADFLAAAARRCACFSAACFSAACFSAACFSAVRFLVASSSAAFLSAVRFSATRFSAACLSATCFSAACFSAACFPAGCSSSPGCTMNIRTTAVTAAATPPRTPTSSSILASLLLLLTAGEGPESDGGDGCITVRITIRLVRVRRRLQVQPLEQPQGPVHRILGNRRNSLCDALYGNLFLVQNRTASR